MFAVSNQEDILLCGAGMRINSRLLAGPAAGTRRLMVSGLSAEDCALLSGGSLSHFPVLIDLTPAIEDGGFDRSVELSRVRALIFRTDEERDRIAYVRTADVRLDDVATEVRPELFDIDTSQIPPVKSDLTEFHIVRTANRIAGSVCGALAVVLSRGDAATTIPPLFGAADSGLLREFAGVSGGTHATSHEAALLRACARALLVTSDGLQEDLGAIADEVLRQTKQLDHVLVEKVEQWRAWLQPRIDYRIAVAPGDLTDERGSPVLRAMTLLLFRQKLSSLVAQRRESGPLVTAIAGALAGFREGLDSIDVAIKGPMAGFLDTTACLLDAGEAATPEDLGGLFGVIKEQGRDTSLVRLLFHPTGKAIYEGVVGRIPLDVRVRTLLETSGFRVRETPEGYEIVDHGEAIYITRVQGGSSDATPTLAPSPSERATSVPNRKGRKKPPSAAVGDVKRSAKPRVARSQIKTSEALSEPTNEEVVSVLTGGSPEGTPPGIDAPAEHVSVPSLPEEPAIERGDFTRVDDQAQSGGLLPSNSDQKDNAGIRQVPRDDVEEFPDTPDLFNSVRESAKTSTGRKRATRTTSSTPRLRKPKGPPA